MAPKDAGPGTCASYCEHSRDLHCPASETTPGGVRCEDLCTDLQQTEIVWNLGCRTVAESCALIDACER